MAKSRRPPRERYAYLPDWQRPPPPGVKLNLRLILPTATPVLTGRPTTDGRRSRQDDAANELWLDWIDGDLHALRELIRIGAPPTDLAARVAAALDRHLNDGRDLGTMLAAALGARRSGRRARRHWPIEVERVRYVRAAVVAAMERGWRSGRARDREADRILETFTTLLHVTVPHPPQTLARLDYIKKTYTAHRGEPIPGELRTLAMMMSGILDDGPEPPQCSYEVIRDVFHPLTREVYDEEAEAWRVKTLGTLSGHGDIVELGGRDNRDT